MTVEEIVQRFSAKQNGSGWKARCPSHEDEKASLSISCEGDKVLIRCFAGCKIENVVKAAGLSMRDLFVRDDLFSQSQPTYYEYRTPDGTLCYRKVRVVGKRGKQFWFERPNDRGGWIRSAKENGGSPVMLGMTRHVYRRHELTGVRELCIAEGEKDCDRLASLGFHATTNDAGAGKWTDAHTAQLRGVTDVWIFEDNDEPGRRHAEQVAHGCQAAGIRARIVRLPGLPEKGDVSDYLEAHTKDDLLAAMQAAPIYQPATDAEDPLVQLVGYTLSTLATGVSTPSISVAARGDGGTQGGPTRATPCHARTRQDVGCTDPGTGCGHWRQRAGVSVSRSFASPPMWTAKWPATRFKIASRCSVSASTSRHPTTLPSWRPTGKPTTFTGSIQKKDRSILSRS